MSLWNLNRNSAPGASSRPPVDERGAGSEDRSATRRAPPEPAAERIRPTDRQICRLRSPQGARMIRGRVAVATFEVAYDCDMPPVCAGRKRDRYLRQVPETPPPRRATGPPGSTA